MAKVPSPFLTGATGKFAGAAFQQSPGNGTILREVVKPTNPSTEAQVEQRAKFKLMSQVASVFKSVIAMKREGNITPRNMFVKINSPLLSFDKAENRAEIDLAELQLTKSVQVVSIDASLDEETGDAAIALEADMPILYGAVFVRVDYSGDSVAIKEIARETVTKPAASISHTFPNGSINELILAYGITQDAAVLTVKYDNYQSNSGETWLDVLSKLAESSDLTKTAGKYLSI